MCVAMVASYGVIYNLFLSSSNIRTAVAGKRSEDEAGKPYLARQSALLAQRRAGADSFQLGNLHPAAHVHFIPQRLHGNIAKGQDGDTNGARAVRNHVKEIRKAFNRGMKQYRVPRQSNADQFHVQRSGNVARRNCSNCTQFSTPQFSTKLQNLCGEPRSSRVDLVVLVASKVGSFEERRVLRDTWLRPTGKWASRTRHVFLVGRTSNVSASRRLQHETHTFGDILQGNFVESLRPQTNKTMLGFTWVAKHCMQAKHVLKVDQDVWVNLPSLLAYLQRHPLDQPVGVAGYCVDNERPIRDPESKYFASKEQYPDLEYPPFCSGPGYVTTPAVAREIVRVSRDVPFFHLEDVYIGFCLGSLRMDVKHIVGFSLGKGDTAWVTEVCQLHESRLILRQGFTPQEIRFIWNEGKCRPKAARFRVGLPLSRRQRQHLAEMQRQAGRQRWPRSHR